MLSSSQDADMERPHIKSNHCHGPKKVACPTLRYTVKLVKYSPSTSEHSHLSLALLFVYLNKSSAANLLHHLKPIFGFLTASHRASQRHTHIIYLRTHRCIHTCRLLRSHNQLIIPLRNLRHRIDIVNKIDSRD